MNRRRLIEFGLAAGLGAVAPALATASPIPYRDLPGARLAPAPVSGAPRSISVKNLHTDEALDAVYWDQGRYVPDALEAVNKVLRDFRTGEVHPIAPGLLDVLTDLKAATGAQAPFQVISGFRSAQTNSMLREKSAEVAQRSLHMDGMAIDLYLDDVDLDRLHVAALDLSRGGVGYYPVTKFIHVDVGPVRHWQGV
jgi:uncharacterized protein YcbK (DUF882 family)